jgi:ribonuclease P/MRP protein subunit POP8
VALYDCDSNESISAAMTTTEPTPQQVDEAVPFTTGEKHEFQDEPKDETMPDTSRPRKKQKKKNRPQNHTLHQITLRKPSWTYFHLKLFSSAPTPDAFDILTAKRYLNAALQRFLGLHGAAIPVDILKLEGEEVWIRVPREDATAVHEAMGGWVGDDVKWVVKGKDEWLVRLAGGGDGQDLFRP